MARNLPKHVYRKPWGIYFAKGGRAPYIRWRGEVGTPEFWEWYAQCQKGQATAQGSPPEPVNPQTFRWLCVRYYNAVEFKKRDKSLLDACCQEPIKPKDKRTYADLPLKELTFQHLKVLRDRKVKAGLPEASITRVKAIRRLCKWARSENLITTNLAADLVRIKNTNPNKGHQLWTRADIEAFERRHPIGSKARLAFDILRYLGAARVDAVRVGSPMVENYQGKRLVHFKRSKTKVDANPQLTEALEATIRATPKLGIHTWLVTEYGKPFSPAGFGNWFRDRCVEAGILDSKKRAHGLRHTAATMDAENGATAHQMLAKYGWMSLLIAQGYSDKANRKRLGASF
jgi:integrase